MKTKIVQGKKMTEKVVRMLARPQERVPVPYALLGFSNEPVSVIVYILAYIVYVLISIITYLYCKR